MAPNVDWYSDDTGWTKVCPVCVVRWENVTELKGKYREVTLEMCEPCAADPKNKPEVIQLRDRSRRRR